MYRDVPRKIRLMEDHPRFHRAVPVPLHERHTAPPTPEIRLLAAILEDACFCLRPGAFVSRETRDDAVAWVRGEVRSAPFCSFREVCDILGLDAQAVATTLLTRSTVLVQRGRRERASAA